jgi:hypothetical protein
VADKVHCSKSEQLMSALGGEFNESTQRHKQTQRRLGQVRFTLKADMPNSPR